MKNSLTLRHHLKGFWRLRSRCLYGKIPIGEARRIATALFTELKTRGHGFRTSRCAIARDEASEAAVRNLTLSVAQLIWKFVLPLFFFPCRRSTGDLGSRTARESNDPNPDQPYTVQAIAALGDWRASRSTRVQAQNAVGVEYWRSGIDQAGLCANENAMELDNANWHAQARPAPLWLVCVSRRFLIISP